MVDEAKAVATGVASYGMESGGRLPELLFVLALALAVGCGKDAAKAAPADTIAWPGDTLSRPGISAAEPFDLANRTDDRSDPSRLSARLPSGWTTDSPKAASYATGPHGEKLRWQYLEYSATERATGLNTLKDVLAEKPESNSVRLVLRPWAGFLTRQEPMIFDGDDRVIDVASFRAYSSDGIMVGTMTWPADQASAEPEAHYALATLLTTVKVAR